MLLEAMGIGPGMSFLALGSGSGFLCALAGRLVGPTGEVRGVEYHAENVGFARRAYAEWRARHGGPSTAPEATFLVGNVFALDAGSAQADRVYVGAGCPSAQKAFFRRFLRPGGVLVVPVEGDFLRIIRNAGIENFSEDVLCKVNFAPLLEPAINPSAPPLRFPSVVQAPHPQSANPFVKASLSAAAEEEARRKAEEARRKAAEEEARRKAAEEEARRKAAEEEARRKAAAEEARRKAAEEEARRKAAEEEARRKAEQLTPGPPTRQSSISDVCHWLGSIGLGALEQAFTTNLVDGRALFELTDADLKDMGVAAIGLRRSLFGAINELKAQPATPLVAKPAPSSLSASQRTNKFIAPASEPVIYKGRLELPPSYKPQGTCAQELLAARDVLGSKVPQLELIIGDCETACLSVMGSPAARKIVRSHGLTEQEVFAIVAYTHDLGLSGVQSENLYFQLNELLRRRVQHEMRAVMGYLYFILGALRKLPAFEGTVFRGNNSPDVVASEYTTGREIFWSGFTSTTTNLAAALDFAGCDGVVFRIKINSGRSIVELSTVQHENEVLLPPNACLFIASEMHREADGMQYVDLIEKKDSFRW